LKYTVRYAHLETIPVIGIGETISTGDLVGCMGDTGASHGNHLHIDCVHGKIQHVYHQRDIESGVVMSAPRQLAWFIDADLFGTELLITTGYADPLYLRSEKKLHLAFDVVPENRHITDAYYDIFWNRSAQGEVIAKGFDSGYGNYIHVLFEA